MTTTVASTSVNFSLPNRGLALAWGDPPSFIGAGNAGSTGLSVFAGTWTYHVKVSNLAAVSHTNGPRY